MMNKRLYKSNENKIVDGVCGGIAEYFGIDPTLPPEYHAMPHRSPSAVSPAHTKERIMATLEMVWNTRKVF